MTILNQEIQKIKRIIDYIMARKTKHGQWTFWRDDRHYPWYTEHSYEHRPTFGLFQNAKTIHMTRKSKIIPFLHLQNKHTYKIFFTLDAVRKMDEDIPMYEEELDEQGRAVDIIYYMNVISRGKTYNPKNGRTELRLFVVETNVPALDINNEYMFDAHEFEGNPVDITSREELESLDGDMFEMVLRHARDNRPKDKPLKFDKRLDRLGHKKYTRKGH